VTIRAAARACLDQPLPTHCVLLMWQLERCIAHLI
jgi:hypothetical protein